MSDETAIRIDDVSKDFILPHQRVNSIKSLITQLTLGGINSKAETQHALKEISFEIKKGEFFGIVGRNGSGKSTLLKILAGIYQPNSGSVKTKGKLVPFIELGVGFNPELSGRENIYLNGAMLGFSEKEVSDMYDDIVSFAELEKFMDQKLKNYSSGMQVRLAFSMAVRAQADILLIDEVLAVGDADFQRKCFEYFKQLKRNKKTVVFVSHDMTAVEEYCDRAALIEKNRVVSIGTASQIANRYRRLFADESTATYAQKDTERWGNGDAQYTSVNVELSDDKLRIKSKLTAHHQVSSPNLGFSIRNQTGHTVFGVNTAIKKVNIPDLHKGETIELIWTVPHIFQTAQYEIDLSAMGKNNEVWDWWEGATTFKANNSEQTPFIVHPPIDLEVRR